MDTGNKNVGRNDPCHCGSGKKYKNCHLDRDEAAAREARAKAADTTALPAAAPAEAAAAPTSKVPPRPKGHGAGAQPWKRGAASARGFQRTSATRKVGGGS